MPEPLLELEDVTAGYGGSVVLRGISMSVHAGEVVGIIGPNGHGKTTLLKTISGLVRARSGAITLDGRSIAKSPPDRIVSSGLVQIPQGDLVFPDMTVEDNLLTGAYLLPSDRRPAQLESAYAMFPKLRDRRGQLASTLSGGERRMLAIGRGLMTDSRILMIDEPSLGLAPIVIDQIYAALERLKDQGRTIVLVEENPSRVEDFASLIHLVDSGVFVWTGTAADLKRSESILETYLGG